MFTKEVKLTSFRALLKFTRFTKPFCKASETVTISGGKNALKQVKLTFSCSGNSMEGAVMRYHTSGRLWGNAAALESQVLPKVTPPMLF